MGYGLILLVSHPGDDHAQPVLDALERLGTDATMLDTAHYPQDIQLAMQYGGGARRLTLRLTDGRILDLSGCGCVWWRRPQPYQIDDEIVDADYRSFAYTESHEAIGGLWQALDADWINPPGRDEAAGKKSYQLAVAQACGLEVPRTLITNDPTEARAFAESNRHVGTIYKTFLATERDWRETRLLRPSELDLLNAVRYAPVIFQEYVPAEVDLRITVVGEDIFAAAIHSQEPDYYPYDFRMDMERARFSPTELPPAISSALRQFMHQLELVYGAIDMRRTPEGRHVFLEVNPSGQWLFVEQKTHQPITDALAHAMADRASRNGRQRRAATVSRPVNTSPMSDV